MTTTTYPDGNALISDAYTPSPNGGTIGAFLHPILLGMIGADASDVNSPLVRFTWPTGGAPAQAIPTTSCTPPASCVTNPTTRFAKR